MQHKEKQKKKKKKKKRKMRKSRAKGHPTRMALVNIFIFVGATPTGPRFIALCTPPVLLFYKNAI